MQSKSSFMFNRDEALEIVIYLKTAVLTPVGRRSRGRPRTQWRNYVKTLGGPVLALHQSIYPLSQRIEMLGGFNLSNCPRDPQGQAGLENIDTDLIYCFL